MSIAWRLLSHIICSNQNESEVNPVILRLRSCTVNTNHFGKSTNNKYSLSWEWDAVRVAIAMQQWLQRNSIYCILYKRKAIMKIHRSRSPWSSKGTDNGKSCISWAYTAVARLSLNYLHGVSLSPSSLSSPLIHALPHHSFIIRAPQKVNTLFFTYPPKTHVYCKTKIPIPIPYVYFSILTTPPNPPSLVFHLSAACKET